MATLANVTLTVYKAESLVALNPGGTSNPVVTATIGSQSASTNVVSKTLNPTFSDATFHFQSCPLPTVLTFKVLNRLPFVDVEDLLGTATITLFDATSGKVEKTVALSHGGNAALAQKAGEKGCGTLYVAYEVMETAASPVNPVPPATFPTPSAATPRVEAFPLPIPAAANISGPAAAKPPQVSAHSTSSSSSSSSTSGAPTPASKVNPNNNSNSFTASNPSATNPAHRSPKVVPASVAPALLPSHLTPPSLTPTRAPVNLGYHMADSAAAAPSAQAPVPVNNSGLPQFVSYPVRGLRAPAVEADETLSAPSVIPAPTNAAATEGLFYANNTASTGANIALPLSAVQAPSNASVPLLPVADPVRQAAHYTPSSLHDPAVVARASSLSQAGATSLPAGNGVTHTPNSFLFRSAAAAPASQPQSLLVVPPHIEGTPKLDASGASNSRPVSAMPLLPQAVATSSAFPAAASEVAVAMAERQMHASSSSRPVSASAAVVAVAPRTAPWSRVNSHANTPSSHALGTPAGTRAGPTSSSRSHNLPLGPRMSRARSGEDMIAVEGAARCSSKNRREGSTGAAAASEKETEGDKTQARQIYADPQYLFENAATGHDLGIFARLKRADPYFANGFLDCRDYAGRTLLHVAAWNGQLGVMDALLSTVADASLDAQASDAATSEKDRLLRANMLRGLFSSPGGNSILHAAAMGGQKDVVAYLLRASNKEFLALKNHKNERGLTPAEAAKESGFTDLAMMLL